VRKVRAAVKELRGRVKPGPVMIGTTKRLTPTRAGFRALDPLLRELQRATPESERELYTFALNVRYRGPDGRFVKKPIGEANVLPGAREVRRRRRKGESTPQAFRRIVESQVKGAVFRQVEREKSLSGGSDELRQRMRGKSAKQVAKMWSKFKAARSVTFKVTVQREIPK
jgi:hypothetical protein